MVHLLHVLLRIQHTQITSTAIASTIFVPHTLTRPMPVMSLQPMWILVMLVATHRLIGDQQIFAHLHALVTQRTAHAQMTAS
jgi:hypothetical protein